MVQILIIADDLTGAFDSAAPFIGAGVEVRCDYPGRLDLTDVRADARVLSVNANTRHLSASEARDRVSSLVADACAAGVPVVVKKTDSVLRGNIGAELEGALEAHGSEAIHFMPALPGMGRVTVGGVQLVGGIPVAETPFAADPFEPVRHSALAEIVAEQSEVALHVVAEGEQAPEGAAGILAYDAATDAALDERVRGLVADGSPLLLAGCAGVLSALARVLEVPEAPAAPPVDPHAWGRPVLAFCGSVNAVSVDQCAAAVESGAASTVLALAEILDAVWPYSPEFVRFCYRVTSALECGSLAVVDASTKATAAERAAAGVAEADARAVVSDNLGRILAGIIKMVDVTNVLVMGGDILLSLLCHLRQERVSLVAQLAPGVVVSEIWAYGRLVRVVSKSGGFGERDMFMRVAGMLSGFEIKERELA